MKVVNAICILIISGICGFLSMALFLGTIEDLTRMRNDLAITFFGRFGAFSLLGIFGITLLIVLNYILNKTVLKATDRVNLKQLAKFGFITSTGFCLIGTIMFFLI